MKTDKKSDDNRLWVFYKDKKVGTLAMTATRKVAFEYDDEWIAEGFSISPFSLPLRKEVFIPKKDYFDGLFGVFADSLPDAWGRILLSRFLKEKGIDEESITVLDRLAMMGSSGMGALTYKPEKHFETAPGVLDLDELAQQCGKILNAEYSERLDELYALGGTGGGARPKILTQVDGEDWIIKFPSRFDMAESGKMEFDYGVCAAACGIEMSEIKLFPSEKCGGYFGTKRFDREKEGGKTDRSHVATAAALLELDFSQPSLDYRDLIKLTKIMTNNNAQDVTDMFKRMCFNVFAHNRDDHSKNFSFCYDEGKRLWRLSPAYDLTYSNTFFGEHTISVAGNGYNPGAAELLKVGLEAGLSPGKAGEIMENVKNTVENMLGKYFL